MSKKAFQLDRTFTHRLHTLSKLTDRVTQATYESRADIGLSEGRCLAAVGAFRPLSINDLAARANLDKAQASRAAQALVARGWVNKVTGVNDRRGVLLTLTPEGNSRWSKLKRVISDRNAEIVACLDDGEQTLFSTLLDRLLAHAERHQINK